MRKPEMEESNHDRLLVILRSALHGFRWETGIQ